MKSLLMIMIGFSLAYIDWELFFRKLVPKLDRMSNMPRFLAGLALAAVSCYFLVYIPSSILCDSIDRRQEFAKKKEEDNNGRCVAIKEVSLR